MVRESFHDWKSVVLKQKMLFLIYFINLHQGDQSRNFFLQVQYHLPTYFHFFYDPGTLFQIYLHG